MLVFYLAAIDSDENKNKLVRKIRNGVTLRFNSFFNANYISASAYASR